MTRPASLVFYNADVVTPDPRLPRAELVAVAGDAIAWVGENEDLPQVRGTGTRVIDCGGHTLVPGFNDAHCHVLAYAATFRSLDCGPQSVRSIGDIQALVTARARQVERGQWVRGGGYHEFDLAERRHPTRWDLDAAAPNTPVRLIHRSGHALVLNSLALALVGISNETPDPPAGVIDRDPETGEPTGLLLEMNQWVEAAVPRPEVEELRKGVRQASQELLRWGVTSVQDATAKNDADRWELFQRLKRDGTFVPRLTMMPGVGHLEALQERELAFGQGDGDLRLGPAKLLLAHTTGALQPPEEELQALVLEAQRRGFPVAVHAVEAEAVEAAVKALKVALGEAPPGVGRHRIEHASELSPRLVRVLQGTGIQVVTQPGFLYYHGDRYLAEVPELRRPWLYRGASLYRAGLRPAAGSDAPVIPPNPLMGIYAAATRRSQGGATLSPRESVSARQALEMYTLNAAYAEQGEGVKGSLAQGKVSDLVLLDRNPLKVPPEELKGLRVLLTVLGGRVVWEG